MELRIRSAGDGTSRLLAEIPFRPEVIDSVLGTLTGWGIKSSKGQVVEAGDMYGQFVDNGERAYFEVVLVD